MIRSQDQQLRDIRAELDELGGFAVTHIDTCLGSFLSDHHNRDGELLIGVNVDGSATVGEVLDGLADEFRSYGFELGESRKGFDYEKAKAAIDAVRRENATEYSQLFDASLDARSEDDDHEESCQAWFLIHWDVPDDDE